MRTQRLILPLLLLLVTSCGAPAGPGRAPAGEMMPEVHAILSNSDGATLYSLHPYLHETDGEEWATHARYHNYVILGQTEVDAPTADEVLTQVYDGIDASDGRVAACFDPRHGIRVETAEGTIDLVICYSCLSMIVYRDGERAQSLRTTESPRDDLAPIWSAAGLELHP